jgi:hypothetical protein
MSVVMSVLARSSIKETTDGRLATLVVPKVPPAR